MRRPIYGPQKGATPDQVRALDGSLARWADVLEADTGRRERDAPGAGAAGGLGFALLAIRDRFRSFRLEPGVGLIMEVTGFDERLAGVDLVITGEGRIDFQTAYGKTALGVARRAAAAGVPCVAVGGGVTDDGQGCARRPGRCRRPGHRGADDRRGADRAGVDPIERAASGSPGSSPSEASVPETGRATRARPRARAATPEGTGSGAGLGDGGSRGTGLDSSRSCSSGSRHSTGVRRGSAGSTR